MDWRNNVTRLGRTTHTEDNQPATWMEYALGIQTGINLWMQQLPSVSKLLSPAQCSFIFFATHPVLASPFDWLQNLHVHSLWCTLAPHIIFLDAIKSAIVSGTGTGVCLPLFHTRILLSRGLAACIYLRSTPGIYVLH